MREAYRDEHDAPVLWPDTGVTGRRRPRPITRNGIGRSSSRRAGEGIFFFDHKTKRVLETNHAFREMLGYDAEALEPSTA